jgi:hypothetical protein
MHFDEHLDADTAANDKLTNSMVNLQSIIFSMVYFQMKKPQRL